MLCFQRYTSLVNCSSSQLSQTPDTYPAPRLKLPSLTPPRHLKDATPAPEMYTHVRPAPPPKKNLLPYPLKGWCTEQADRSSPLIPFYPSGFSNKCAPQAFNLWPLHLPAPQSCKKKKKLQKSPSSPDTCFPAMCFSPSFPPPLSLSLGVDPWASALVSHRVLWLWDG